MKNVLTMRKETVMKQFTKYICAFLMMVGMSVSAWGTTTSSPVIFPAGTTSSYTAYDWSNHGAPYKDYPTSATSQTLCVEDGSGFTVTYYYAGDYGSNGLQLKKGSSAYVSMTIASSNGFQAEITYSCKSSNVTINLTGASDVTADATGSGTFDAVTITTTNTNATLKINGTSDDAVYIKYVKITPRNSGTITIGHDDCYVGKNVDLTPTTLSKTVTLTSSSVSGDFDDYVDVAAVNMETGGYYGEYIYYGFKDESDNTHCTFTVLANSTLDEYSVADEDEGTLDDYLLISYTATAVGTYTATLYAYDYYTDDEYPGSQVEITLVVESGCDANATFTTTGTPTTTSNLRSTSVSVNNVGLSSLGATGCSITSYGYCWGTSANPTTSGSHYEVGTTYTTTGTAFGSYSITGLTANQKYYIRPYATNGNGTAYGPEVNVTTLQRYTITYNKNDGSGASATEYKDHGISYTISSNKYSRSGYTLVKWHTLAAGTGGTDYAKGASYTGNANLSLHAVWGGTISYNNNGGSGSMDAAVVVSGGSYSLPSCTFTPPSGKKFKCWAQGAADGTEREIGYSHTVAGDITFYAVWRDEQYTDYKFSCADWSVTGPSGDIIFITSTASKTVRSQEAFHVSGSGLPHSTALTFTTFPASSKFVIKKADGTIPSTDEYGVVDADVYVFYTPSGEDTGDGLDEFTSLTVSVTGEPRTATIDTKRVIGRHIATDFVIAVKRNNKWLALPATMNDLTNPSPVEIAVDNIDNPSAAYTAASNIYNLYGQNSGSGGKLYTNGETVKLGMKNNSNKPLFGSATGTSTVKGDGTATVTNNIGSQYWWTLSQTATSITNPQDAQYSITCSNNTAPFVLKENAGNPQWGFFTTGSVGAIRLIPATDIPYTEAYFVEWGQHGGVIEVDATGIDATSVVAHLNGASSSAITLVQTKASDAKNKNSKYNYTVNFGDGIDFADAASNGAMLTLEWKNGATTKAVSNIVVPKIVASNITINKANYPLKSDWNTEVHVLPGKTVTVDPSAYDGSNVTIKELNIYPGATVVASTGTLIATNLVLRNGWSRAGSKTYDVARLHVTASAATLKATNVYADWYIDYDQYYPVAVPWNATVANFSYRYSTVSPTVGPSANIRLKYYDGESRATNVQEGVGIGANWKTYGDAGCTAVPATLEPSKGYAMTAKRPTGKAFSIIRMPLTLPSGTWADGSWTTNGEAGNISTTHKDQVYVKAYNTGSTPIYAQGWNLIANPYMSLYNGTITLTPDEGDATTIKVVNIPDVDFKEYGQYATTATKLKPSSGFLIQTPATGTITFGTANRIPSAPSYRTEEKPESTPEQQAYIMLNNENSEDMMGLFVSEKYTADYDLNGDVEKLLSDGTSLRTYMHYGNMNLAYVALTETLAREWIPVTVRVPQSGEYTFSLHEASIVGELEGVYLIDYANGDRVTNLIDQNYTFVADAGTINGRFAINAIVGERQTPTDIDIINGGGDLNADAPQKFIYHDKMYIYHRGVIYDATGKRVREINK